MLPTLLWGSYLVTWLVKSAVADSRIQEFSTQLLSSLFSLQHTVLQILPWRAPGSCSLHHHALPHSSTNLSVESLSLPVKVIYYRGCGVLLYRKAGSSVRRLNFDSFESLTFIVPSCYFTSPSLRTRQNRANRLWSVAFS